MALVARARCSFRGEDAGSVNSQSYWRDRGRCHGASSAAWGHRLYFAKASGAVTGPTSVASAHAQGRAAGAGVAGGVGGADAEVA
jgi:hypothetical protein